MVPDALATELREQGRGVVGALLVVGLSAMFTVETWWAGWQLPGLHLVAYAVVGLAVVLVVTRNVGFRSADGGEQPAGRRGPWPEVVTDFFEVVVQSFVAAYGYFLLFGVIEPTESATVVARLGLVQVVPLGFGASLANQVLSGDGGGATPGSFAGALAVFALGATFLAAPIAPTEEVEILAANAGWLRLGAVVVVTLGVTYLTLYELEFRGQQQRLEGVGRVSRWGQTAVVYAVGCTVAFGLLATFGHFGGQPAVVWVQKTVVLGLPASVGASAARVVLA